MIISGEEYTTTQLCNAHVSAAFSIS